MKGKKKYRFWYTLLAGALLTATALSAASCGEGEAANEVEAAVWTASSSVKVKQEDDYSDMYGNASLSFSAFRNENESAQVFFNPEEDVEDFSFVLSDLKDSAGNVLKKDSFSLYGEKYIQVETISDPKTQTGAGYYPDALVPLENLADCGENTCAAGYNQGIWVKFKPSKTQEAGVYTGTFQLVLDGTEYDVPVRAEVLDYTLSDEKHTKQDFGVSWVGLEGTELDSTLEMQEAYYEFFQDYRIDLGNLPGIGNNYDPGDANIDEILEKYVERLAVATLDERVGTARLPYVHSSAVDENGETVQCINLTQMRKLLSMMMEYTLEHEVNLFSKVHTYFMFLDEDTLRGQVKDCNYTLRTVSELYDTMVEEYRLAWSANGALTEFQEQVLSDLKNIPNLCVGVMVDTMTAECTYVPLLSYYTSDHVIQEYYDHQAACYDNGEVELWTYTCENPKIPYPTYHIEDTALSTRMFSWMMYEYNIVGNLLWQAALGGSRGGDNGSVQKGFFQDQYGTARKFMRVNGDGFLVYPGREYGVYGPVASVRLEGILDGNEDYELLYALEQNHIERAAEKGQAYDGESFDNLLSTLTKELYTGVVYNYKDDYIEVFEKGRKVVNDLLLMSEHCGMVVENIVNSNGVVSLTISAPEGTQILINGTTKSGTVANGIVTYNIDIPLENDENVCALTAKHGEREYTVDFDFGGKVSSVQLGEAMENQTLTVEIENGSATVTTVDAKKAIEFLYNVTATETVTGATELQGHTAFIKCNGLDITANDTYLILNITVEEDMKLAIAGKGVKGVYISAGTVELTAGTNEIRIELSNFNLKMNGKLEYLRLRLADDTQPDKSYKLTLHDMLIGG